MQHIKFEDNIETYQRFPAMYVDHPVQHAGPEEDEAGVRTDAALPRTCNS